MKVINSLWKIQPKETTSIMFLEGIPIFLLTVSYKIGEYRCYIQDFQTKACMFSKRVGGDTDGKNVISIEIPKLFGKMYSEIDTTFIFQSDEEY